MVRHPPLYVGIAKHHHSHFFEPIRPAGRTRTDMVYRDSRPREETLDHAGLVAQQRAELSLGIDSGNWQFRPSALKLARARNPIAASEFERKVRHLPELSHSPNRVVVLGAGDCRRWSPRNLLELFREVTLADADDRSLLRASLRLDSAIVRQAIWIPGLSLFDSTLDHPHPALCDANLILCDNVICDAIASGEIQASDTEAIRLCYARTNELLTPRGLAVFVESARTKAERTALEHFARYSGAEILAATADERMLVVKQHQVPNGATI